MSTGVTPEAEKPPAGDIEIGEDRQADEEENSQLDEDLVDWDSPSDPDNPRNWPKHKIQFHILLVGLFTLNANLAATMFAPGAAQFAAEFGITDDTIITLAVSVYLAGIAFGPLLTAPLSEIHGRLMLYHICNVIYICFTIGCALSTNAPMFYVFRFIAGCASSAPVAIGGGTIADLEPPERRAGAMSLFMTGALLGPVLGPVIGGFVAFHLGWRWTFWLIAISAGSCAIVAGIFMRETSATILLIRKAKHLRKETGNPNLHTKIAPQSSYKTLVNALTRPLRLLILSPIVSSLSIYVAYYFTLIFILFTTFTPVFEEQYGFSAQISGLSYLGLGIGFILAITTFTKVSSVLRAFWQKRNKWTAEKHLVPMIAVSPLAAVGFFWYGWSVEEHTHWIVPLLGTGFIAIGFLYTMIPAQLYLVDSFGAASAASALAANLILRVMGAAFLTLAGPALYSRLGLGWGNSLLGFLCLAFMPAPILIYRYGAWLQNRYPIKL